MELLYRKTILLILIVWMCTLIWILDLHRTKFKSIYYRAKFTGDYRIHREMLKNKTFYTVESINKTMSKFQNVNISNEELLCTVHSNWKTPYFSKKITTNRSSWTFEEKQNCSSIHILEEIRSIKPKFTFSITCAGNHIQIRKNFLKNAEVSNINVPSFQFGDTCLGIYVNECCRDKLPVPNILHYVIYNKHTLTFFEFVSFISAMRFIRPCAILIHGDKFPNGIYWKGILELSPNIIQVKRKPPDKIFEKKIFYMEHAGDLMRIEALLMYGGIYLDTDTVIVKSLDPLRKYPCTMSKQSSGLISSAFIMAEKNASFLQRWLDGYRYHYKATSYVFNAMEYTAIIHKKFNDLIHIEYGKISRPWRQTGFTVYNTNFRWGGIYGMHLFSRSYKKIMTTELVKYFNSTVGSICRHVLFGNKELCFKS